MYVQMFYYSACLKMIIPIAIIRYTTAKAAILFSPFKGTQCRMNNRGAGKIAVVRYWRSSLVIFLKFCPFPPCTAKLKVVYNE